MISEISANYKSEFNNLANACLQVGAGCVQLKTGTRLLSALPGQEHATGPALEFNNPKTGLSLHIFGTDHSFPKSIAETMFDFFIGLLAEESEMESLTAALIETQDRLVSVYDLGKAIRRIVDIPTLLNLLVNEVSSLLTLTGAYAVLQQTQHPTVICQHSDEPIAEETIEDIAQQFQADTSKITFLAAGSSQQGIQRGINIPILQSNGVFAFMGIYSNNGDFTSPDIKLASALAEQVSAQIENTLMMQESIALTSLETEMTLARQVQIALLPQTLPEVDGLDLYAISIPAHEVGGDFFDLIVVPGHPLTFVLGDVTGKGMPSALLMTMTRTVARSAARNMPFTAPHQLVNRLNTDLLNDYSSVGMFCTSLVGMIDPASDHLEFSNAGQSPVIYLSTEAEPVMLEAQDIPIGIFEGYNYGSESVPFKPGDIFVVASDGFVEAHNDDGEMFGYERMKTVLHQSTHMPARDMANALFTALANFTGNQPQNDDRTILIIKKNNMEANTITIHSNYEDVQKADEKLRAVLTQAQVSETIINSCELALHELLTNLVDHAYHQAPNGQIKVLLQVDPTTILMETRDQGEPANVDLSEISMPDPLDLLEGGYGLAIIQSLMDELYYRYENGQNIWRLKIIRN